jgi:AraC family transcriptional regulator
LLTNTEPIIACNPGTMRADTNLGCLTIHDFIETTGVQQIVTPDYSIFLLGSGVTVTDVWEGQREPQHTYETGDLILLPPRTEVNTIYVSNTYSETMVRMPAHRIDQAAEDLGLDKLEMRYCAIPMGRTIGLAASVKRLTMVETAGLAIPLLVESLTVALAAKVVRAVVRPLTVANPRSLGLTDMRKRRALEFIESNIERPITLSEIAAAAALSPYHFARGFKESMGVTPVRYLWRRRMDMAKVMLQTSQSPLVEIAFACGYSAQGSFTTAFKLATGTTPAVWRRTFATAQ